MRLCRIFEETHKLGDLGVNYDELLIAAIGRAGVAYHSLQQIATQAATLTSPPRPYGRYDRCSQRLRDLNLDIEAPNCPGG